MVKLAALQVAGGAEEVVSEVSVYLADEEPDAAVLPERPLERLPRFGGDLFDSVREASREAGCVVAGPAFERDGGVAAPLFDSGVLAGVQEKVHLYGEEQGRFSPGEGPSVFDTSAGRLVVAVCFDVTFPEYVRRAALEGAEALLVPAEVPGDGLFNWETYLRARALENRLPLAAANSPGAGGGRVLGFGRGHRSPSRLEEEMASGGLASAEVDLEWASDLRRERLSENRFL